MRVLLLNHYAGSPEMGMEFRPYYLSHEWVEMGNEVRIIAGDYSHLRRENPTVKSDFQHELIDGVNYYWLKTGKYNGNGVKRALSMLRYVSKLFLSAKKIAKWKPDVVIASSTYPLDTYAAQRIAKLVGAKYIHEVHDMWPATLYEVGGMSKRHPFVILMQIAENSAYKHCDKLVSLLPYAKEYMVKHGLSPEKFVNIQNGVVEEEWKSDIKIPEEHERFFEKIKDKFVVGYFGGHALSNALDLLLDTAAKMKNKEIVFVLVGEGIEKERLMERARNEKIENVVFLSSVEKKAIPDLVQHFDCSIMLGKQSPLYKYGLCLNKMFDSMMAGKPVVCGIDAPDTLIDIYRCGISVNPSNINNIVEAITDICEMTEAQRVCMGERGRQAVLQHFTYKKLAKQFLEVFE